jgi:hypothetical protein
MPLELPASSNIASDISLKKYDKVILTLMVGLLLLTVGAAGWGLFVILPLLITMAENGIILLAMLAVAAFMALGVFNIFINLPNYILKMKMSAQALRRKFISGNPIAAIDVSIASLKDQYDNACKLASEADGATKHLSRQLRADDRKSGAQDRADNEDRLAQAAITAGKPQAEINDHLVKAERAHRTVEMLQPLLERQQKRQARVEEARQIAKSKIGDLEDQKANMSIILDAYQADAKQSRALSAFFGSRSKDMATIEIAVDEIVKQSSQAEAEIEQMLRDADPAIQEAALQREADALNARARLDASLKNQKRLAEPLPTSVTSLPVKDAELIERTKQ